MNNIVLNNDDCKNQLKTLLETQLRASRKDDKKAVSDSKKLLPFLTNYLKSDKSNMEWTMERLRNVCYELADYNPNAKDKNDESMKSKAFETRVTRAIKDSLLVFRNVNPIAKNKFDDIKNGYQINKDGNLTLPNNILFPTEIVVIEGVKQERPNKDTDRIEVASRLREKHFASCFSGVSRKGNSGTGKVDFEKIAIDLEKHLSKLSDTKIYDITNDFENALLKLEDTIEKVFAIRANLRQVNDKIVNVAIK
jgi:hypothetical protein